MSALHRPSDNTSREQVDHDRQTRDPFPGLDVGNICSPDLENFAAFAKLLENRLNGVPPENVDLRGIPLTGYDIKTRETDEGGKDGGKTAKDDGILKPVGAGGAAAPELFLSTFRKSSTS